MSAAPQQTGNPPHEPGFLKLEPRQPPPERRKSSLMQIRAAMLWVGTIGAFLIGLRHILPGEAASGGAFDAFCPFGAIETLWAYATRGQTLKTTSLLNFAPTVIGGPHGISVRKVDLAVELQILSYYEQRRATAVPAPGLRSVPGEPRRGATA